MDDKLLSKVCFNMMTMAEFIRATSPTVYNFLFNLDDEFTKDELKTIIDLGEKNITPEDIEDLKNFIDELVSEHKEESNG